MVPAADRFVKKGKIMRYVILDLEATCWEDRQDPERQEIIEVGAVMLESAAGPVSSEFCRFVHPVASRELSAFCTRLTSITQADVDGAETFAPVFHAFEAWIGPEPFTLCSWGAYDLRQLQKDCARHKIAFPDIMNRHINLKQEFSRWRGVRPMGMKAALAALKIPLAGTHHRGVDDARNIARIAALLLPWIEDGANRASQAGA
jgi:inhibitor of KinA sporulation pathway (predicted exonuclease)